MFCAVRSPLLKRTNFTRIIAGKPNWHSLSIQFTSSEQESSCYGTWSRRKNTLGSFEGVVSICMGGPSTHGTPSPALDHLLLLVCGPTPRYTKQGFGNAKSRLSSSPFKAIFLLLPFPFLNLQTELLPARRLDQKHQIDRSRTRPGR
jgi:hypothetical protein